MGNTEPLVKTLPTSLSASAGSIDCRTNPATKQASLLERWQFWRRDSDPFDGKRHFSQGYHYRRPDRKYVEGKFNHGRKVDDQNTEYRHRDIYGRITFERKATLTYISPTESAPKPLMVQATKDVLKNQPAGDWRRVELKGKVPTILKIAEWALHPANWLTKSIRVLLVVSPVLILLSLPLEKAWEASDFENCYTEFPNYSWDYPKHARNLLDSQPDHARRLAKSPQANPSLSTRVRLLRPRQLMVYNDGQWVLDADFPRHTSYIFISYTNVHYPTRQRDQRKAEEEKQRVEKIAQVRTLGANMKAYWIDFRCCAPEEQEELHTADVHRMCDVIRGAEHVLVLVPKLSSTCKREWGARMWTLPEALLARRQEITFTTPEKIQRLSKLAMTDEVWEDGDPDFGNHQSTRLLAEHFSSVLTLGRLELFTVALDALAHRSQSGDFSDGDTAYALMGLLHYRIQLDKSDSLFQALARLSLANDGDRLIERMVCMFPHAGTNGEQRPNTFLELTEADQFGSQLWDIEPLCQVAGVGFGDREVILDSCRGVSIRWKGFPQMKYKRSDGFRKLMAEIVLRSGIFWAGLGLGLLIKYLWSFINDSSSFPTYEEFVASSNFSTDVGLVFLGCLAVLFAFLLTLAAPSAVRRLYGGRIMQSAPWLIGFEGTMPVAELEQIVFGNCEGRLSYEPSSTPFSRRNRDERIGVEPSWVLDPANSPRPALAKDHRLFTLVDTGSLTVSIFSAVRPPSVALIAGREGGMLRTVLCHYERSNNCLYKESVIRMDSVTLNQASTLSWIKLGLGNDYIGLS